MELLIEHVVFFFKIFVKKKKRLQQKDVSASWWG